MSPVNLHGVTQHSCITSAKQKLNKVVGMYKNTIAEGYDVSKVVLDTSDSVFEESDAQWKVAKLEWLHEGEIENCFVSWEDSYTDTGPQQVVSRVHTKTIWCKYLIWTVCELKKVGGILAKPVPKKSKTLLQKSLDLVQSFYEYIRQMPGKKDYMSISINVHKQKWLVLCNLSGLCSAFIDK